MPARCNDDKTQKIKPYIEHIILFLLCLCLTYQHQLRSYGGAQLKSKEEGKDQESIQSSTTANP